MVGGTLMAYLGGIHFWWPKITGKLYNEKLARIAVVSLFIGFNVTFLPQFILGYLGFPRRYPSYPVEGFPLHVISTFGTVFLAIGYILPVVYLTHSLFRGEKAPDNPWGAKGLEWQIASPPTKDNFPTPPVVPDRPYAYPISGAET